MANFGILQPIQSQAPGIGAQVGEIGQPLMGAPMQALQASLPSEGDGGGLEEIGNALGQLGKLGRAMNQSKAPDMPISQSPVSEPNLSPNPLGQMQPAAQQIANVIQGSSQNPLNGEKLYGLAKNYLGNNERDNAPVLMSVFGKMGKGGDINPQTTPWCAAFVNGVLESGGVKGSGSLAARSLLNWGTPTDKPSVGDVVVLSRGNDPTKGHTGFFAGYNQDGSIRVLGGNQGARGEVSIANYPAANVLGYRQIPTASQIRQNIAPQDADNKLPMVMAGIAHVESGGSKDPYTLISKPSRNGDRAYGKYQIMGNNIPSWSKMAIGQSMTPEQFMSDPAAQERIAAFMINQNLKRGYSPEDAASIWFSGRPQAKAGNSKDVYGTTVPQYVQKFKTGVNNYVDGIRKTQVAGNSPSPMQPGGYLGQPPIEQQNMQIGPRVPGYLQNPRDNLASRGILTPRPYR